ncbi:FAD/NAD(P)-binding oxidoreductase [Nonomuraea terrae]|uniref:FAD/NAD(P)-binding oxidoreductase n=1 Tax=Nonomuraea terrae TaxID=2530383 RepID=A0A4R4Z5R6_9ACTN|nr:NAD(P)/FAD-dependent oxidoreductase [Nonomuraea terrae]TDD53531.1 FAD/NAD(P)-binding oxidoreductase [Nonomuraea terrae]
MRIHDVAVIGAGVVGCAVARELAAYELDVALVEARDDVGDATSKANTAILHTGFDAAPGTLESRLVPRGYALLSRYAGETGIAVEPTGAVLVAWDDDQLAALPGLRDKAVANGYHAAELVGPDFVYGTVPALGPGALGGMTVPGESIIDPWSTTLAFAYDALARGVGLRLGTRVEAVESGPEFTVLRTSRGDIAARWVVNAAGLGADVIDGHFGHRRFTVTARRGELIVFDTAARPLAPKIVLPVPTSRGKGVLISPTVFGNVMLGPTSEDLPDRTDTSTSEAGIASLLEKGRRIMPSLLEEEITTSYAGLRAATEHGDYVVDVDAGKRYACLGGIRSTGLTASMSIAEHLRDLLDTAGLPLKPRAGLPPPVRVPVLGEASARPYQNDELIRRDAEYGRIVCFCEKVTRGEVRDAFAAPIPPRDLNGLRRRTRATLGRCQGFFCGAEVGRLFDEATGTGD